MANVAAATKVNGKIKFLSFVMVCFVAGLAYQSSLLTSLNSRARLTTRLRIRLLHCFTYAGFNILTPAGNANVESGRF